MKKIGRDICFCVGFIMMFALPDKAENAAFYFLVWFPAAVGLLAASGAFKRPKTTKK